MSALITTELIKELRDATGISVMQCKRALEEAEGDMNKALAILKKTSSDIALKKGEKVGYSGTFTAPGDMTIAVLPLGYNDGMDRRLSNRGVVTVNGVECPIIGLISMNITTIDATAALRIVIGQEVVVFSDNPDDPNSVVNASKAGGILPHEMLIHIAESTKRVLV